MKIYTRGLAPIITITLITVVLIVIGILYSVGQNSNTLPVVIEEPTPLPKNNEYRNTKYNFTFNYPLSWTLEEKGLDDSFTGTSISITNPELPKKMYDCCYSAEETEINGTRPSLVLKIIESVTYPSSQETFGPKTKSVFNALVAQGYSVENMEALFGFIPSVGESINPQESDPEDIVWKDGCNDIQLVVMNGNYIVKFSGCPEGVVKNTGALFVREDGIILKLEDMASEYSNFGDFDKVLGSFEFN